VSAKSPSVYVVPLRGLARGHRFGRFAPWTKTVFVFSESNQSLSVAFSECLDCGIRVHTLRTRAEIFAEIAVPRSSAKSVLFSHCDSLSCKELLVQSMMER
jgi:hypothetical protein